jgi:hypothetical protein
MSAFEGGADITLGRSAKKKAAPVVETVAVEVIEQPAPG